MAQSNYRSDRELAAIKDWLQRLSERSGVPACSELYELLRKFQLSREQDKINITNIENIIEGGDGVGDDVAVNAVDVVDPDFNDTTPAAPATDDRLVKWQKVEQPDGHHKVSGYVTVQRPVRPPSAGSGPIIGGRLSTITNLQFMTPGCQSAAAPPGSVSSPVVWPVSGWIGSVVLALRDTLSAPTLVRGGFGYVDASRDQYIYDMYVRPGSSAGAYGDGSQYLYVSEGVDLRGAQASTGVASQTFSAWASEFNSVNGTIPVAFRFPGVSASSTAWMSMGGIKGSTNTEKAHRTPLPQCSIGHLYIRLLTSQPADGSLVITVYKNGSAQSVTVTVPASAAAGDVYADLTNSVSFSANDQITIEAVNNGTADSATGIVSYLITPAGFTALYYGYFGSNEDSSPTVNYDMPFFTWGNVAGQTEGNSFFPSPRPFSIPIGAQRLWLNVVSATCTCDWTVRKNGSDTAVTINIPTTATAETVLQNAAAASFAKLDRFTLSHTRGGAGASHIVCGWSIALV